MCSRLIAAFFVSSNIALTFVGTVYATQDLAPNAEANVQLNVRHRLPNPFWKLWRYDGFLGEIIYTLRPKDEIEIENRYQITEHEWFRVKFRDAETDTVKYGFVYAGQVGIRDKIQITDSKLRTRYGMLVPK